MNFKFLVLVFIVFSYSSIIGQSKLTYGIGMAYNSSTFSGIDGVEFGGEEEFKYKRLHGFSLFTRANYDLNERIRFSVGPGISFKGARDTISNFEGVYLDLPIITQFKIFDQLYLATGLQYEYLVNMAVRNDSINQDINDDLARRNFLALHLGLNYNIKGWVELGFSYKPTLQNFLELDIVNLELEPVGTVELQQRNLQFSVVLYH